MDKFSNQILSLLTQDSRLTAAELASLTGRAEAEVKATIKALEDDGVIVKYSLVLNTNKCKSDGVSALIEVKVTPQKSRGFDAIAEEIYRFDEVKSVYLMSGGFDLAVFVEGETLRDVAMFVSEKLSSIETVVSTATHFILKQYKSEGVVFEEDEESRLCVQP